MVAGSASVQRLSNEIVKKLRALLYSVCAACLNPKTGSQQHMIYKMWDISLSFHGFNSGTTKSSIGSRPISNASLFKALFGVWSNFNRFVLSTVLNTIHSNLRCRGSEFILKRQFFSWTKKKWIWRIQKEWIWTLNNATKQGVRRKLRFLIGIWNKPCIFDDHIHK